MDLALKLLDEDEIRGYKLHVEVAKFQLKGEYDASKKKKKCKDYKKKLSLQQKFVLFFPLWKISYKYPRVCFWYSPLVLFRQMYI